MTHRGTTVRQNRLLGRWFADRRLVEDGVYKPQHNCSVRHQTTTWRAKTTGGPVMNTLPDDLV